MEMQTRKWKWKPENGNAHQKMEMQTRKWKAGKIKFVEVIILASKFTLSFGSFETAALTGCSPKNERKYKELKISTENIATKY